MSESCRKSLFINQEEVNGIFEVACKIGGSRINMTVSTSEVELTEEELIDSANRAAKWYSFAANVDLSSIDLYVNGDLVSNHSK